MHPRAKQTRKQEQLDSIKRTYTSVMDGTYDAEASQRVREAMIRVKAAESVMEQVEGVLGPENTPKLFSDEDVENENEDEDEENEEEDDETEDGDDEGGVTPTPSPTARPTPPGVSPSSPTSGVSKSSSSSPSNPNPLLPRFFHSSPAVGSEFDYSQSAVSIFDPENPHLSAKKTQTKGAQLTAMGDVLYPLFCISLHEHAWMSAGYGVWGKEEWLKHFWPVLDWHKVSENYREIAEANLEQYRYGGNKYGTP